METTGTELDSMEAQPFCQDGKLIYLELSFQGSPGFILRLSPAACVGLHRALTMTLDPAQRAVGGVF